MLRIGNIEFDKYPVFLAPMEDVTDSVYRSICKEFGVDMMYTEFVASDALIRGVEKGFKKFSIKDRERPIGIQIYGHLIDSMVEAAKIVEEAKPDLIDINFGCPVKKIANRGAGAGMLKDIDKMVKMTEEIIKNVNTTVTAKTRLGWDQDNIIIEDVAERLQDTGIKALTIHGRTRSQLYKGEADWSYIGKVKNNPRIKIPIIGNGDIDSAEKAKQMFDRYAVDAIMVGRGTIGRPWLLAEIREYLKNNKKLPELSIKEKVEIGKKHLKKNIEHKGEYGGVLTMRRHFAQYFKGLFNYRPLKIKLLTADTHQEVIKVLDEIAETYKEK